MISNLDMSVAIVSFCKDDISFYKKFIHFEEEEKEELHEGPL